GHWQPTVYPLPSSVIAEGPQARLPIRLGRSLEQRLSFLGVYARSGGLQPAVNTLGLGQVYALVGQIELKARFLAQVQGQAHAKGAAAPQFALQGHLAAQQLRKLADDRQSQAGPRVLARERIARLAELLEDQLLIFRRDADTGVG